MVACQLMVEPLQLRNVAWALTTITECVLLTQLVRRKFLKNYPWFCSYVASTILQSLVVAVAYRLSGISSTMVWNIAWGSQLVVVLFRFQAVVELTRKILHGYLGIWALAWRVLLGVGVLVLANSLLFSKGDWYWISLNVDRGMELSIAAVIVTLLLFARYYRLPIQRLHSALMVGLCLYSAFFVLDYTLLEKHVQQWATFWGFLDIITYFATLLIWLAAVSFYTESVPQAAPPMIPKELYGKLSSELNLRLHHINRQLNQLLRSEDQRR
jgi:hypothetical protein